MHCLTNRVITEKTLTGAGTLYLGKKPPRVTKKERQAEG